IGAPPISEPARRASTGKDSDRPLLLGFRFGPCRRRGERVLAFDRPRRRPFGVERPLVRALALDAVELARAPDKGPGALAVRRLLVLRVRLALELDEGLV